MNEIFYFILRQGINVFCSIVTKTIYYQQEPENKIKLKKLINNFIKYYFSHKGSFN